MAGSATSFPLDILSSPKSHAPYRGASGDSVPQDVAPQASHRRRPGANLILEPAMEWVRFASRRGVHPTDDAAGAREGGGGRGRDGGRPAHLRQLGWIRQNRRCAPSPSGIGSVRRPQRDPSTDEHRGSGRSSSPQMGVPCARMSWMSRQMRRVRWWSGSRRPSGPPRALSRVSPSAHTLQDLSGGWQNAQRSGTGHGSLGPRVGEKKRPAEAGLPNHCAGQSDRHWIRGRPSRSGP